MYQEPAPTALPRSVTRIRCSLLAGPPPSSCASTSIANASSPCPVVSEGTNQERWKLGCSTLGSATSTRRAALGSGSFRLNRTGASPRAGMMP